MYNNIRLYPFDTDEDEDEEVQLNESIRVNVVFNSEETLLTVGDGRTLYRSLSSDQRTM